MQGEVVPVKVKRVVEDLFNNALFHFWHLLHDVLHVLVRDLGKGAVRLSFEVELGPDLEEAGYLVDE